MITEKSYQIEENIFKRSAVCFEKLKKYGFKKQNDAYVFETQFMDGDFAARVVIGENGKVSGCVYDAAAQDEYYPLRVESMNVGFAGQVRAAYEDILRNIRDNCCTCKTFAGAQANRLTAWVARKYGDLPQFPWDKYPQHGVFKNPDNGKWYALIMTIDRSRIQKGASGEVEVMNLKISSDKIPQLVAQDGFYPAYHMNKQNWLTVVLDDTVADASIEMLLEESHAYSLGGGKKTFVRNVWILPANPKFFDIIGAFEKHKEINWKQSGNIKVGDVAYMYVGAPYSAVMYKCEVMQTDIPYAYKDNHLTIKKLLKIRRLKKYGRDFLPFATLKEFGINAVRGPRGLPEKLVEFIEKNSH